MRSEKFYTIITRAAKLTISHMQLIVKRFSTITKIIIVKFSKSRHYKHIMK